MHDLSFELKALVKEGSQASCPKLNSMIAAVAAVIQRNGDVHDLFEYKAIEYGQKLLQKTV